MYLTQEEPRNLINIQVLTGLARKAYTYLKFCYCSDPGATPEATLLNLSISVSVSHLKPI